MPSEVITRLLFCEIGSDTAFEEYEYDGLLPIPPIDAKVSIDNEIYLVVEHVYEYSETACSVGIYVERLIELDTEELLYEPSEDSNESEPKSEPENPSPNSTTDTDKGEDSGTPTTEQPSTETVETS